MAASSKPATARERLRVALADTVEGRPTERLEAAVTWLCGEIDRLESRLKIVEAQAHTQVPDLVGGKEFDELARRVAELERMASDGK